MYPGSGQDDLYVLAGQPLGMPPLAHWGLRVGAAVIDGAISYVPNRVVYYALGRGHSGSLWGATVSLIIALILWYAVGTTGRTPGKRAVGIRLLREADGSVLGFGRAAGRWFLHILDAICCGIGYLWPLWDGKRQTFADKIAHSVVVKA
jgi:uncharacterized RDD family membrane protein YckC